MKNAHAFDSPRQHSHQSSDNVLSVSPPIPPHSIIKQLESMPLSEASFLPSVSTPGPNPQNPINLVRLPGECPPRSTLSARLGLSGTDALRWTGQPRCSYASFVATAPFLVCLDEHDQAKCILVGDVFPSVRSLLAQSRPWESKQAVEGDGCLQGQGRRGIRPSSQIVLGLDHGNRSASSCASRPGSVPWLGSVLCRVLTSVTA